MYKTLTEGQGRINQGFIGKKNIGKVFLQYELANKVHYYRLYMEEV